MKRIIIYLLLSVSYFQLSSQNMQFDWISQAGGPGWDIVCDMKELPNGQLALVGTFYESINFMNDTLESKGSRDIFVALYSPDGSLNDLTSIGGSGYDYAKRIETDGKDGMILPLKFYKDLEIEGKKFESTYTNNYVITWLDAGLNLNKHFLLSSTKEFDITSLQANANGDCYFTGWFTDTLKVDNQLYHSPETKDIFAGKIAATGELLWFKHLSGEGEDFVADFVVGEQGNYLLGTSETGCFDAGMNPTSKVKNSTHLFIAELDTMGNTQKVFYPAKGEEITPLELLNDSNKVWVLANFKGKLSKKNKEKLESNGKSDVLLLNYQLGDSITQHFQLGGMGNDEANGIIKSGENLLLTGLFSEKMEFNHTKVEAHENGTDIFIASIDANCKAKDIFTLSGESSEFPCSAFASQSGVYVTGEFRNKLKTQNVELVSAGKEDIFLARVENCSAKNPLNIEIVPIDDSKPGNGWELDAGPDFVHYSWNDDYSNSRYLLAAEPGTYTLSVSDFFGCDYTKSIVLVPEKSTKAKELTPNNKAFKLYPTVTAAYVYWEPASQWKNATANVKIFDSSGKIVFQNEIKQLGMQNYTLNFSKHTEGTYLVEIAGEGFREISKVMVKK